MMEFVELCFMGATFPATILMILILFYGLLVALGALDISLFDIDFDADVDVDSGVTHVGFVALKFLNIGNVPIMIWVTAFGFLWWATSLLLAAFYDVSTDGGWGTSQLILRNVLIAIAGAKLATEPMRGLFDHTDDFKPDDLIGQSCEVTTYEATENNGQAKFITDAAPLLINVRTETGTLNKGDVAIIVDYDPDNTIYFIAKIDTEVSS